MPSLAAGAHRVSWSGVDASGRPARPGMYWVRLSSPASHVTKALVRLE